MQATDGHCLVSGTSELVVHTCRQSANHSHSGPAARALALASIV
jgi:hypothetical protein